MRVYARFVVLGVTAMTVAAAAASAQTPPASTPAAAAGKAAAPTAPPANFSQVLGIVNGENITRGDLVTFLSRYEIPRGNDEVIYRDAMDTLVNTHLVNQFLARQRIPVAAAKVNEQVEALKAQLKQDGTDLATELIRSNKSLDEVTKEIGERLRWVEYVNAKATDAELKRFVASRRDLFNGTQVRASHILLRVDPKASPEDKEKIKQKLIGLKGEIESNKTTFAQAANKHSEDPANSEGSGGDVGFFGLNSGFIEEFANAAFALKKGSISDAVETPYGFHLIQVTDRKEGTPLDFEQNKPFVKQMYAADLQKTILTAERKTAKVDIKPMPADLFPPAPTPAPAPAAAPATAPASTKGAAAPK